MVARCLKIYAFEWGSVFKYSLSFELGEVLKNGRWVFEDLFIWMEEVFKNGNHPFKDLFVWNMGSVFKYSLSFELGKVLKNGR